MSPKKRFYHRLSSVFYEHKYKQFGKKHKCSYCCDPEGSRHRREKNKLEIIRELANLYLPNDFDTYRRICYHFHNGDNRNNGFFSCNMEIKLISARRPYSIK